MTLTVNGVNMLPYVAYGGLKWQRADVDGPNAGRAMDATVIRDRVATKIRLDVTCRPLYQQEASTVLTAIMPEFVSVTYTDPQIGGDVTKTMYSNNNPAQFLMIDRAGREMWSGITFPLIER